MKRLKYPLGLLACLLVSAAVPLAYGSEAAKDPRVPGLIAKVNSLQKQVNGLTAKTNCIGIQGVVLRGGGSAGYLYTPDAGATLQLRSAIDAPVQGESPQLLMGVINPQCVSTSKALFRNVGTLSHGSSASSSLRLAR